MPKFKVVLLGEYFEVLSDTGEYKILGFYTTRVFSAASVENAEFAAVDLARGDKNLLNLLNKNSKLDPKIYLESVTKVTFWRKLGGSGYSFFPMDEN